MFSRIGSTLQAAANVVAPPCARVDDFKYHWQQVLQECHRCQANDGTGRLRKLVVSEETHAPKHLKQMAKVLVEDSGELCSASALTPCLEFVVQERILVVLVSYAWADRPLGIRQYVYIFLSEVLKHLHHSYLHQMRIHKPLQTMIKATCEKKASPYEQEEMDFLRDICEKVKEDPSILLLYIEPLSLTSDHQTGFTPTISGFATPVRSGRNSSLCSDEGLINSLSGLDTPICDELAGATAKTSSFGMGSNFPLIEALLNLCHSSDSMICCRAHECLLSLTALRESRSSSAMARHTLLSHYVASRLASVFADIPEHTEPAHVDTVCLEGDNLVCDEESTAGAEDDGSDAPIYFPGRDEVAEFLRWVALFDKLIGGCEASLGACIRSVVRELFLEGVLGRRWCLLTAAEEGRDRSSDEEEDEIEDAAALTAAIIAKMIQVVASTAFSNSIIMWLMDNTELDDSGETMRQLLFRRCASAPRHLQTHALRLLQGMLEARESVAVYELAVAPVLSRAFVDAAALDGHGESWSDEEDERARARAARPNQNDGDLTPGTPTISRTFAPSNINKIVKMYLSLVPEEMRSSSSEDFDSYKADALRQYRQVLARECWVGWSRETSTPASEVSSVVSKGSATESSEATFIEGPLIKLLLDFLEALPEQDYDISLQVTSLVSWLALLPSAPLHEFLLNPTLPLAKGVRSPYTCVRTALARLQPIVSKTPQFRNRLRLTRFQLLGAVSSDEMGDQGDANPELEAVFEAEIVLEEFSKELAAIAYAKCTVEQDNQRLLQSR